MDTRRQEPVADLDAPLDRSHLFSLEIHRLLSARLSQGSLEQWRARILANINLLEKSVTGPSHERSLERWRRVILEGDVEAVRRHLTGLDDTSVHMREVGPFLGIITQEERQQALQTVRAAS